MTTFALSQEDYEALVALARIGSAANADPAQARRNLDACLRTIETANGVTRYAVWVQPLPPSTSFPASWPPTQRAYIEFLTRPVAKVDVAQVLQQQARKPVTVLVTRDPAALLGWTPLDLFFLQ